MLTQFITLQIPLPPSPLELSQAIATALHVHGIPLRWAITQVDRTRQMVEVEAVITLERSGGLAQAGRAAAVAGGQE